MGELYSIETRPSPTLAFDTVTQRAMALEQLLARSRIRASGVRLDRGRWRHRHCGTWRSEKRDEHDKRSGPHSRRHKHLAVSFRQIHAKRRANNKYCQPYSRYQVQSSPPVLPADENSTIPSVWSAIRKLSRNGLQIGSVEPTTNTVNPTVDTKSRARRRYCPRMKTRRFRACGRQYGSCPETGFETITPTERPYWASRLGGRQYGKSED